MVTTSAAPGRQRVQLRLEGVARRLLLLGGVLEVGKTRLHRSGSLRHGTQAHCLKDVLPQTAAPGINRVFLGSDGCCLADAIFTVTSFRLPPLDDDRFLLSCIINIK